MSNQPLINGHKFSFASAEIDVSGSRFFGFQTLNWKQSVDHEKVPGSGPVDLGTTVGHYTADTDFTIVLSEFNRLLAKLGPNYTTKPFNIGCAFIENPGDGLTRVEILGVKLRGDEMSNEGTKGSIVKVTLTVITPIRINGVAMIGQNTVVGGDAGAILTLKI